MKRFAMGFINEYEIPYERSRGAAFARKKHPACQVLFTFVSSMLKD